MTIEQTRNDVKRYIRIKEEQNSLQNQIEKFENIKYTLKNDSLNDDFKDKISSIDKKIKEINLKNKQNKILLESIELAFECLNAEELKLLFEMHGSKISKTKLANQRFTSRSNLYRKENKILEKLDSNLSLIRDLWQ